MNLKIYEYVNLFTKFRCPKKQILEMNFELIYKLQSLYLKKLVILFDIILSPSLELNISQLHFQNRNNSNVL